MRFPVFHLVAGVDLNHGLDSRGSASRFHMTRPYGAFLDYPAYVTWVWLWLACRRGSVSLDSMWCVPYAGFCLAMRLFVRFDSVSGETGREDPLFATVFSTGWGFRSPSLSGASSESTLSSILSKSAFVGWLKRGSRMGWRGAASEPTGARAGDAKVPIVCFSWDAIVRLYGRAVMRYE